MPTARRPTNAWPKFWPKVWAFPTSSSAQSSTRRNRALRTSTRNARAFPVTDRVGVLAEIVTLAAELGVDVFDIEIAHSPEGDRGVVIVVVETNRADLLRGGLIAKGFRPSAQPLR